MSWAHVSSGRVSRGPRFRDARAGLPAGEFTTFLISDADSYFDTVAGQGILLDREQRRDRIAAAVNGTVARAGGAVESAPEDDLLEEVTDLVEAPQAILGSFEQRYLELPPPILTAVMKKHQRYFPSWRNPWRA